MTHPDASSTSPRVSSAALSIELVRIRAAAARALEAISEIQRLRPEDDWRYRTTVSIVAVAVRGELEGALAGGTNGTADAAQRRRVHG